MNAITLSPTLRRRTLPSPVGPLTVVADDEGVVRILFVSESLASAGLSESELPETNDDPIINRAAQQLEEYFAGARTEFDLPLHLQGTEFQQQAWLALADIPFGQTTSYGRQAQAIGRPGAFRAVGAANGKNPVPIVLPCHRVIGADGSLTGFGGGLDVKQQLLDHERSQQSLGL